MSSPAGPDEPSADVDSGAIADVFGDRGELARRYAHLLASDGVEFGLLGPREGARVWDRHLFNSVAISKLIQRDARVVDVGSGAGLPGIPLAIGRPDLTVTLLEPLLRRVEFLRRSVSLLGLESQVTVLRGRADDPAVRAQLGRMGVVTARAVAPLARLVRWCEPVMADDGVLIAVKGASAADELARDHEVLRRLGLRGETKSLAAPGGASVTVIEVRRSEGHEKSEVR